MKIFLMLLVSLGVSIGAWIGIIGSSFVIAYSMSQSGTVYLIPFLLTVMIVIFNPLTIFVSLHLVFKIKSALLRNTLLGLTIPFSLIAYIVLLDASYYRGVISYSLSGAFSIGGSILIIGLYALIMITTSRGYKKR